VADTIETLRLKLQQQIYDETNPHQAAPTRRWLHDPDDGPAPGTNLAMLNLTLRILNVMKQRVMDLEADFDIAKARIKALEEAGP